MEIVVEIREVVNLQPFDLLLNIGMACQERRHDDHGPQTRRYPIAEFQLGQRPWLEQGYGDAIHQRDRQVQGRNEREQPK